MGLIVKICGVTSAEDARLAVAAGADAIGINFHPPSPRFVPPARAGEIVREVPPGVWRVGVFVNRPREEIRALVAGLGLDTIQFHGEEPEELCRGWEVRTIRAIRLRGPDDAARLHASAADYVLADAFVPGARGGTGQRIPLEWLAEAPRERLIVAGGLGPETVAAVVRALRPAGVDVASGVEDRPGHKDPRKLKEFIDHARAA